MKVVILAGGYGTRISEKTDKIPKPMIEIGGRPIVWHIMNYYASYGFNEFILCLGYKADYVVDYFKSQSGCSVHSVDGDSGQVVHNVQYENNGWVINLVDTGLDTGTGGRMLKIAHLLPTNMPFHMTYGDGLCDVDIGELYKHHMEKGVLATVTAITPPSRYGYLEIKGDMVDVFEEKPVIPDHMRINGGYFILEPDVLKYISLFSEMWEQEPMHAIVKKGQLTAYRHNKFWHCIDTLRDYNLANEMWLSGEAPWKR